MSVAYVLAEARRSFGDYVIKTPTADFPLVGEPTYLADYIEAWVKSGHAAHASQGNFERYLIGVVGIIDEWIRNPEHVINYIEDLDVDEDAEEDVRTVERRVSSLFREGDEHRLILSRDFFDFWAFREFGPRKRTSDGSHTSA